MELVTKTYFDRQTKKQCSKQLRKRKPSFFTYFCCINIDENRNRNKGILNDTAVFEGSVGLMTKIMDCVIPFSIPAYFDIENKIFEESSDSES